jgi:tetratricopeptide (TPR) repeat protein
MEQPNKVYPASVRQRRARMLPVVGVLLIAAAFLQHSIDPTAKLYHKGESNIGHFSGGLNNEFLLLPLLGFREAAAGLLWVRCDEFFHSGDYDAILPLVRLITLLDPHAENVYVTGAWHLAYNFTDSSERSDRRYISPSEALLREGIDNNPNIPDIKFELGWQNYDKIKDYIVAEEAFTSAIAGPNGDGKLSVGDDAPYAAPLKTLHILAHTYEKQGRIPEAMEEWQKAMERSEETLRNNHDLSVQQSTKQMLAAEKHNYAITLQRYYDRYTTKNHSPINPSPYPRVLEPPLNSRQEGPWDVAFRPQLEVTRPKVFKVSGRFNAADGLRVEVRIMDWNYKERPIAPGQTLDNFDIDLSQTILVDSISVKKTKYERELDMSKDPKMYGFNDDYYRVILFYSPRVSSPHLQDRFGWSGEGMTDSAPGHVYVDKRDLLLGTTLIEGQGGAGPIWDGATVPWKQHGQPPRLVKVTYKISKDQVNGLKPITDRDIVPNE